MTDVVLNSSSISPANPATPPTGWELTAGSVNGIRVDATYNSFFDTDNAYSGWNYQTAPARTGNIIKSRIVVGASSNFNSGYTVAATIVDSSGAGYMFEVQPYAHKIYKFAAGQIGGTRTQVGTAATGAPPIVTDYYELTLNTSTGALTGLKNGVSVVTATDTTYTSNTLKSGFAQAGFTNFSGISQVTAYDVTVYSVTSINDGNQITYGQADVGAVLTGSFGPITSVTAAYGSGKTVPCTVTDSTANAPKFNIGDRVDGSDWPTDGTSLTFTFSDGTNTATGTQTFGKKAGEIKAPTWSGAITSDMAYASAQLYADNFEVQGGEWIVKSPNSSGKSIGTLYADGDNRGSDAGTYETWFIPASDKPGYTGRAGKVWYYEFTIIDAGAITPGNRRTLKRTLKQSLIGLLKGIL